VQWQQYANITGYFSCIYGTTGIENTENPLLSGSDERLFVNRMIDLVGNEQPKGGSVQLTIDPKAQQAAYDGLQNLQRQYGPTKGAVVALDPSTGAVLAMATQPTYNPNLIATHDPEAAKRAFEALVHAPDNRGLNRGAQLTYPPGSTFKMVTASAALSNGYTPESTVKGGSVFDMPGSSDTIKNENGSDCGGDEISLTHALEVSCNVAFADLGVKLGASTLQDQAEKYGFNDDVLDDLPSAVSVYPDASTLDEAQTSLTAIGQYDDRATPLQMAMVGAGIANGGAVMKPYVVQQVRAPNDLETLDEAEPEVLHQAISSSVADQLTQMMVDVVENGTGTNSRIPGVSVAGKTGTANSAEDRAPYAWMVAFAPADDPKVAVAVLVEQTGVGRDEISGNGLAGPIARSVMEAVINP
jgi:peptidoglycan glycosyltransferase